MGHRNEEESVLLYWCKPCRDVTEHVIMKNYNTKAVCQVCKKASNVNMLTGSMNAAAQRISMISRKHNMKGSAPARIQRRSA